jgi:hypothetical protein
LIEDSSQNNKTSVNTRPSSVPVAINSPPPPSALESYSSFPNQPVTELSRSPQTAATSPLISTSPKSAPNSASIRNYVELESARDPITRTTSAFVLGTQRQTAAAATQYTTLETTPSPSNPVSIPSSTPSSVPTSQYEEDVPSTNTTSPPSQSLQSSPAQTSSSSTSAAISSSSPSTSTPSSPQPQPNKDKQIQRNNTFGSILIEKTPQSSNETPAYTDPNSVLRIPMVYQARDVPISADLYSIHDEPQSVYSDPKVYAEPKAVYPDPTAVYSEPTPNMQQASTSTPSVASKSDVDIYETDIPAPSAATATATASSPSMPSAASTSSNTAPAVDEETLLNFMRKVNSSKEKELEDEHFHSEHNTAAAADSVTLARNWNEEFQRLLEMKDSKQKFIRLRNLGMAHLLY